MSLVRVLDQKGLAGLFVALSVCIMLISLPAMAAAAPTGTSFNHIVIIAMENQNYGSVIGSSSAPFINSLAAQGTTISNYHSYGQGIGGCSAGCYQAFTQGQQSVSDSWCPRSSSPCSAGNAPNIADQLKTAGLTSAMFCEDGCPRGADHFPWIGYASTWNSCLAASGGITCNGQTGPDGNLLYNSQSSGGNTAFINYLDSATPANYIWFTPTDSHNMHDNSVSSGDAYLQTLLVGTGSISSPSANSVLGSNLFKTPGTFLYVWWDEYDPSPNVEYGNMIKVGYTSSGGYTEYNSLHTIEANWGLPYITSVVSGDSSMSDIFGSITPLPLSATFTYLPATPIVSTPISFTAIASGGTAPYTYAWSFGDGGTSTGVTATHTYSTTGAYSVTLSVTDLVSGSAKSTQTITIAPIPALTASFTFTPSQPTSGQSVSFTGTATGGVSPYAYSWSFGDGGTSTSQNPTHTYSASGTYTVSLNITDNALTHSLTTQSITITPPGAPTASFNISPSIPVSGQTVTFTATVTGGTSPYSYSWNIGGTSKTGNPVSQSFTNGTYTVSLTVTDGAGKTATASKSLVVLSTGGSSTVPVLIGWGGIRLDEAAVGGGVNQPSNPPASLVFPGEKATNMELILIEMKAMGYNTVRVDFDPYCTGSQYMSTYSATNIQRAIQIAQYFGFWIIIDYHGYSEPFNSSQASCWLNFWSGVTSQFKNSYNQIIWEPLNEPCYDPSSCAGSSTTNNLCSGASACVTILSQQYQAWIDQTRAQGDTHWIVVQNICSYGCSLSNWATGFPSVTDPLGTLSHGGKIFISLHSYMGYSSSNWTNSTADSMAQQYYQAVVSGVSTTGWPALNTEGGADPLCTSCAPDQILTGSAGYTTVTFHFIQALTNLYDSNSPQRINWIWWPAGSWTNTPGAGVYGAMQCASAPIGWGCLLKFLSLGPPPPDFTITASSPSAVNAGQSTSSTITTGALNGFTGTIILTYSLPSGLTCGSISPGSVATLGTASVSCSSTVAGTYTLAVTGTSGSLIHTTSAIFKFQDFRVSASSPSAVSPGSSAVSTISLTAVNGFGGSITIADSLPSGLSCGSLSTSTVTGSGTATLSCSSTSQNVYTVTITAVNGALTHTTTASFTFGIPPDFTITASSPSNANVGASSTSTITVGLIHGFTNTLTLSATAPSGLSCGSLTKTSFASNGTATVTCSSTIPATYYLTITGTSGALVHTTTATFTFLGTNLPPSLGQPLTLYAPGAQSATVGNSISFVVYARNPMVPTAIENVTATGLAPNMSFNPATGAFSFTPTQSQAGKTFIVNFTATDPSNQAAPSSQSVAIHVAGTANQPSGGGFCLNCFIPRGFSLTMWLFVIGGLIGVISSIAVLNIRAHAELAGMRRRHHNPTGIPRNRIGQGRSAKIRAITEHHHRTPIRHYEDN
jgi:PKD repeat protein